MIFYLNWMPCNTIHHAVLKVILNMSNPRVLLLPCVNTRQNGRSRLTHQTKCQRKGGRRTGQERDRKGTRGTAKFRREMQTISCGDSLTYWQGGPTRKVAASVVYVQTC